MRRSAPRGDARPRRVVAEYSLHAPPTRADEVAMMRELGAGLRTQQGARQDCLIDRDGERMLFSVEETIARLVREAWRRPGADLVRYWTGSVYTPPRVERAENARGAQLVRVVGERTFDVPITLDELAALERSCTWCARSHRVRLARFVLAHDGRRAIVLFRAPDAESVRLAYRRTGLVDRVWACRRILLPAPMPQTRAEVSK